MRSTLILPKSKADPRGNHIMLVQGIISMEAEEAKFETQAGGGPNTTTSEVQRYRIFEDLDGD